MFASRAGIYIAGLANQSLLAYLLLPEGRGSYAICVTFAYLISVAFVISADRGAQYLVMARKLSVSQGMAIALTSCMVGSALTVLVALPLIQTDFLFFQKADASSFYLALILVPLTSISLAVELQMAGLMRFGRLAVFLSLQAISSVVGTAWLVWVAGLGVDGAIMGLFLGYVIMIVAGIWDLRRNCGLIFELPSLSRYRDVLVYGAKYHLARLGIEVEPRLGVLILGVLASRADIGIFAVASVVMLRVNLISGAVGTVLYPRVARGSDGRIELTTLCVRLVLLVTGVALLVLLGISTPLVRILLSDAFVPVVPLMWVMAPGILAYACSSILLTYFNGVNRPEVSSWSVWVGLMVNVVLLLVLYPRFGIEGAAWSMTIGMICRTIFFAFMFRRATKIDLSSTWVPRQSDLVYLWSSGRSLMLRTVGVSGVQ